MYATANERGVLPGLIAGYIFLAYAGPGMSDFIGNFSGSGGFVGSVIHLIVSMVIGSLYTGVFLLYLDFGDSLWNVLLGGSIFGLLWWIVGWNFMLPATHGADILQLSLNANFYGHIIFGHVLAFLVALFDVSLYYRVSGQSEADGYGCVAILALIGVATIVLVISKSSAVVSLFNTLDTATVASALVVAMGAVALIWAARKGVAGRIWTLSISALELSWDIGTTVAEIVWNAGTLVIVYLRDVGTLFLDLVHSAKDGNPQCGQAQRKRKPTRAFENGKRKMANSRQTPAASTGEIPMPLTREKQATSVSANFAEIPVFGKYKGHSFEATLVLGQELKKRQKIIRFEGTLLTPSASALKAVNTVKPSVTGWGGWQWWMFWDPVENRERQIIDIRNDDALLRRLLNQQ